MTLFSRFIERRGWSVPTPLVTPWGVSTAGQMVDRSSAVALSAVWACIRLLTSAVSRMPVDVLIDSDGIPKPYQKPRWLNTPILANPNANRVTHFAEVMVSLLLDGNAFILTSRDNSNDVSEVFVLDPLDVEVKDAGRYTIRQQGASVEKDANDICHLILQPFPGMKRGISPLEAARQMIGLGLAAQQYGSKFFTEPTPPGIIEVPRESRVDPKQLVTDWLDARAKSSHAPGVLTGGGTWRPLTITNEQAQFLQLRQFQVAEIARWYGVPPHMIGDVERSTSWGTGIEQMGIGFVTYSLNDYLVLIEEGYRRLVPNPQSYLRFNRNALLRGDAVSRAKLYDTLWKISAVNADEIRAKEDWQPKPDDIGQRYYANTQWKPETAIEEEPAEPVIPTNGKVAEDVAGALVGTEG